ncbi:symmetrical bis(5'-nucleosyl)-tetraphosphatase [Spongiibacter nanhainus]|uniref:bis(5'-nucleosyl)-tetraphosphatase (symmetrical) n=1 Tax=Spongiibacter nanhainus TaxID=2794344 RepID=A0A7T4URM1_9GAMM|nr:symmetrical bis(5'-nucleosyl)-tetraphosphatase [Spongiibacter nanhainus]QQD19388.1 symmetrical bis(5'-nucleosyl)-tetraphosphatase [Spongiibacter nanhainus]
MTRYAVGDLQGCLTPLKTLLERVNFDPAADQLWLVGDLVARGPDSLDTLRFLYPLRHSLRITLGNHDLHTLSLARSAVDHSPHPTVEALLKAPDCGELMDWLQQQALVHRDPAGDFIMSHAGIPPIWTSAQAVALSGEVQAVLQSPQANAFLSSMYGNQPDLWRDDLHGLERLRCITNYLTRMRICDADGRLNLKYKGELEGIPAPHRPWFEWQKPGERSETLIFGHWAALNGNTGRDDIIGLDTGCVWGNCMTLFNLETLERLRCDC